MTKKNNKNHSRSILHLFGYRAPIIHGITSVYLLLLLPAVPYAAAQSPPLYSSGFNPNVRPSMVVIIIVLVAAFFFVGLFSLYIRQCVDESRHSGSPRWANGVVRSRRGARGLDLAVIETFPTFIYSVVKGLKIGKGTLECAVCLNEFEDDEKLRLLPKCDHVFHPDCIDAWLTSHTTCPVCRANLEPESGEATGSTAAAQMSDSDSESDDVNRSSDTNDAQNQVSIGVTDDQNRDPQPEVINPAQISIQNRPVGSRSRRPRIAGKFPRSHSTGHSLVQPGENCERFTLRLPEEVRKQIVNEKLNRTTSCISVPNLDGSVSGGSTRRGNRGGGEGSSRGKNYQSRRFDRAAKSDRWMFSMAPPFFSRTSSIADGEASANPKASLTSVKAPFEYPDAKADGAEQSSSARPPV